MSSFQDKNQDSTSSNLKCLIWTIITYFNKMFEICNLHPSNNNEPEDLYFSRLLKSNKSNLPSSEKARAFACESEYFDSFGSHASQLYLKPEEQGRIYSRHFSHLTGIVMSSYRAKASN